MRLSLVKFTDVLNFEVDKRPRTPSRWCVPLFCNWSGDATGIRWKLPKLTDQEEAAMRDEIYAEFGAPESSPMEEKVYEWRMGKRPNDDWENWKFEIVFDCHHQTQDFDEEKDNEKCKGNFHFHDDYYKAIRPRKSYPGWSSWRLIEKPADVEFLLQVGSSYILFNAVDQKTRDMHSYPYDRFIQLNKSIPFEVCKQLRNGNVSKDQVSVTVFGVFPDGEQQPTDVDVTIVAGSGELIDCHSNFFTKDSRVLLEKFIPPTTGKPFVIEMLGLSKIQVEAFLWYQQNGATDKILEAAATSLGVLKAAERYEVRQMWRDTMKGLIGKDSDWFEGEIALEFTNFLGKCSKRGEKATQNLIQKISYELRREMKRVEEKSANGGTEESGEVDENRQADETPTEFGDNPAGRGGNQNLNTMNEKGSEVVAKMLEYKWNSVSLLKAAQAYKNDDMWNDVIAALLEKDLDWFERNVVLELKTFLDTCSKRDEETTKKLTTKLCELVRQPVTVEETAEVRDQDEPTVEIDLDKQSDDLQTVTAKRRKVTHENQGKLKECKKSPVETPTAAGSVSQSLRRSTRLLDGKRKQNGSQTEDETGKKALRLDAERKKTLPKPGKPAYGPRDIWRDPLLPKVAIIPDPEVKVEKVEPPEEDENEDSAGIAAVAMQRPVGHEVDSLVVKEEGLISMEDSAGNDGDGEEYGVVKLEMEEGD